LKLNLEIVKITDTNDIQLFIQTMTTIGRQITTGAAWMVLFKILERSIGLVSTIILARLLLPQDFGLIAMAMSIIAACELLYAFSFDLALIQKQQATQAHYDTAWSFNVVFGVVSAVVLVAIAPLASAFYEEQRLELVIYFLAVGMLITSLQNIGVVDFRKKMEFNKEFKWLLSKKIVAFIVTVSLAFTLKSYWALIVGMLSGKLTATILSYYMHPYRPRISFAASRELFGFSTWLLFNNILFFLKLRAADFVIGRIAGSKALGFFSISYEISNLPTTELIAPINRAVFPGYATMSKDLQQLRQGFINVLAIIMFFALPIGVAVSLTSVLFVPILLGEKWLDIIPVIQVLAFFGVVSAMQTNIGSVFLALGKPKIITYMALLYVVILIPSLIYAVQSWGILGAAWTYLAVSILTMPLSYHLVLKATHSSWVSICSIFWRPAIASIIMYFCIANYLSLFGAQSGMLVSLFGLLSSMIIGAALYVIVTLLFWTLFGKPCGSESIVLERLSSMRIKMISQLAHRIM